MKKIKIIIIYALSIFIFAYNAYAGSNFIAGNITYYLPGGEELTEHIVNNLSYKIHLYGGIIENNYKESPPLTLSLFKNGIFAPQGGEIHNITFGKLESDSLKSAVVYFTIFDGVNNAEHYLAIITPQGNKYHITQAIMDYAKMDVEGIQIKNGKIYLSILSHGPNDPRCCPSLNETLCLKITKGKIVKTP